MPGSVQIEKPHVVLNRNAMHCEKYRRRRKQLPCGERKMADSIEDLVDSSGNAVIDTILQYGLFVGAIFQIMCIFAVILLPSKDNPKVNRRALLLL